MTRATTTRSTAEFLVTLPTGVKAGEFMSGLASIVQSLRIP